MSIHSESLFSGCDVRPECGRSAVSSCRVIEALTARERDILVMISQDLSKKHIARAFEISPETVKSHVKHILLKLVRILGFDPLQGTPRQENIWQRIHPDNRDRVWAEVQEASRQSQLRAILNVLPVYAWYGNPSGSLLFVNNRQADFLGVP